MKNHAMFFAFANVGIVNPTIAAAAVRDLNGKGWNANLSYRTAQQLKAQGIIE